MLGKLKSQSSRAVFRSILSVASSALLMGVIGCGGSSDDSPGGGGGGGNQFAGNYVGNVPFTPGRNGDVSLAVNSAGQMTGTLNVLTIMSGRVEVDFPISAGMHNLVGTVDSQGNFNATEPNSAVAYSVTGKLTTSGAGMSVAVRLSETEFYQGGLEKEPTGDGGAFKATYRGEVPFKEEYPSKFEFAVSETGALTGKLNANQFVAGDFPLGAGQYNFSGTVNASGNFTGQGSTGPNSTFNITGKIISGGSNMSMTFTMPSGPYIGTFNKIDLGGGKTSTLAFTNVTGNFSNTPWSEGDDSEVEVDSGYISLDITSTAAGVTRLFTLKLKEGLYEVGEEVDVNSNASITLNQYEPNDFMPKAWFAQTGKLRIVSITPETLEVEVTDVVFGSVSGLGGEGNFTMNGVIRH